MQQQRAEHQFGVVQKLTFSLILVLSITWMNGAQQIQPEATTVPIVTIGEAQTDLSPTGLNIHSCVAVLPDGRFHLEVRRQQLPAATATLQVFESQLNEDQLEKLRTIIQSQGLKDLPSFVQPVLPVNAPWFGSFEARIARAGEIQRVGYWVWRGGTPDTSPNSTDANTKQAWQRSMAALRPLVEWFHGVGSPRLKQSLTGKPTFCDMDDD